MAEILNYGPKLPTMDDLLQFLRAYPMYRNTLVKYIEQQEGRNRDTTIEDLTARLLLLNPMQPYAGGQPRNFLSAWALKREREEAVAGVMQEIVVEVAETEQPAPEQHNVEVAQLKKEEVPQPEEVAQAAEEVPQLAERVPAEGDQADAEHDFRELVL
ncbi:unnamed protein product [Gongylonema pulchrum]|uniref:Genome assembly, chromosome: II n=1 Tax=Gongylonema pulchrum TaxID=637853 RepID=A0A183D791_9BILA|nr:unnamed protein product [Gongylonema pulchrum]